MKTQACPSATLTFRLALALVLCSLALALRPAPASAATCKWKSAASGNWNTAGNWLDCGGGVPGSSDDVVIDATGANYTISVTDNRSVNSIVLNSANATLFIEGNSSAHITLWVGTGLTNAGTVRLRSHFWGGWWNPNLTVASGTFTNHGTFNTESIGGTISANLINNGTVNIYQDVAMNGTWTNTGAFNIASGATLSASSGDVFNQDGGTLTVDGAFYMNLTTFNFDGGAVAGVNYPQLDNATLNFGAAAGQTGGIRFTREWNTMSGDVPANVTVLIQGIGSSGHSAVTAASGFTNAGTIWLRSYYSGVWYHSDLTVASGTFVNQGNFNTDSVNGTISANLSNSGAVNIYQNIAMNGTWTNTGAFTIASGATLSASSGDVFNQDGGTLTVDGAFYMNLTTFNFDGGAVAGVNYPQLDNATLNFGAAAGQTGGIRFTREWNTMSGDVPANVTVLIQGIGSSGHSAVTAASGFTNAGTIWLRSHYYAGWYHADLTVATGTFANQGSFNTDSIDGTISANLSNSGAVYIYQNTTMNGTWTNTGAFTIASGATLSASSGDVFNQDGGTLTVDGTFYMNQATFNFDGGAVAGSTYPRLDNATLNFGPAAGQTGSFRFTREWNTMSGDVPANVTVLIQGIDNSVHSKVTAASGFTNAGTITLQSHYVAGWYASHLTVSSGTLTNQGTINAGSDGGSISTDLTNTGTVNINANTTFPVCL